MNDKDKLLEIINKNQDYGATYAKSQMDERKTYIYETPNSVLADSILADGWIRPPLSLNQIVWHKSFDGIVQCRVSSLTQKADGSFKIRLTDLIHKFVFEITPDKIGNTVFLTEENAEEILGKL